MKTAEIIILPETGITEIVREKLKKGMKDNTTAGDSNVPNIQFFETFDDCDITNPDCIISVFNSVFGFYCQEKKFGPLAPLLLKEEVYERNFIEIINLAFSISINILNTPHPNRLYSTYRCKAGGWTVSEYPQTLYFYDSLSTTKDEVIIPPSTFNYDCVQQNLVFSMVYCLCKSHQLNTDGSEIQQLLQYIYKSDDDIQSIVDEVFKQQTPLWCTKQYTNSQPTPPTTPPTKRGCPKTKLFSADEEKQIAGHFRNFLHTNGYELAFTEDMNDKVNIALMCFLYELDINLDRKDTACFRFLKDSCGLEYNPAHQENLRTGHKWCKEFAKVKNGDPKGATLRLVGEFMKNNNMLE